jgi:hypothetical protein
MASKPSLPASLFRTYTSLLSRRTSQLQSQASRILGIEIQSHAQDAWRRHIQVVTNAMNSNNKLQPIPIPIRSQFNFGQRRWHSTDFQAKKDYSFDDVSFPILVSIYLYLTHIIPTGPIHNQNPLRLATPHRRPRTPRVQRKQYPHCHKHTRYIAARCAPPGRRRLSRSLWLCEAPAE